MGKVDNVRFIQSVEEKVQQLQDLCYEGDNKAFAVIATDSVKLVGGIVGESDLVCSLFKQAMRDNIELRDIIHRALIDVLKGAKI